MKNIFGKILVDHNQKRIDTDYNDVENDFVEPVRTGIPERNATYSLIQQDLPDRRARIFEIILKHPNGVTSKEIAKELGWTINCVTGRISELRDKEGLICKVGTKLLPSHDGKMYPNSLWGIPSVE